MTSPVQGVELQVVVHPGLVPTDLVNPLQRVLDPPHGLALRLGIAHTTRGPQFMIQQTGILREGIFHFVKLAGKLLADQIDPQREHFWLRAGKAARSQAANLGQRHPHIGNVGTQFRGQREFADAPRKCFDQGAVSIRGIKAAAGKNGHHGQEQADAHENLYADWPFYQHGRRLGGSQVPIQK